MELNIDGQVIQIEELGNAFIVNDPELLEWENEKMEMVNEGREMLKKIFSILSKSKSKSAEDEELAKQNAEHQLRQERWFKTLGIDVGGPKWDV